MKSNELRQLSLKELYTRLRDENSVLQKSVFTRSVNGQLENPSRIRAHRRQIARLITLINEHNKKPKI